MKLCFFVSSNVRIRENGEGFALREIKISRSANFKTEKKEWEERVRERRRGDFLLRSSSIVKPLVGLR